MLNYREMLEKRFEQETNDSILKECRELLDSAVFMAMMLKFPLVITEKGREKNKQHKKAITILTDGISALKRGKSHFISYLEEQIVDSEDEDFLLEMFELEIDNELNLIL